jgi:hypothetical protein
MTPELFNGSFFVNSATGQYMRIPGVRELVTVDSHSDRIEINEAPIDILRALPQITPELAQLIVAERSTKAFSSTDDLTKRISGLAGSPAMEYVTVGTPIPTGLVSRATVRNSGASRTVRLSFKREERMQTVSLQPFLYKKVIDIKFGHWQF